MSEWFIIALCGAIQLGFWVATIIRSNKLRGFFRIKDGKLSVEESRIVVPSNGVSEDLGKLVVDINSYAENVSGAIDANVIKDKVEGTVQSQADSASSFVSFPTYLGLLGTFVGVLIGLNAFNTGLDKLNTIDKGKQENNVGALSDHLGDTTAPGNGRNSGNSDENTISIDAVSNLIEGVVVSMVTSIVGLILTLLGMWSVAKSRKKVEKDQIEFLGFVYSELIPVAAGNISASVGKLTKNLSQFVPKLNENLTKVAEKFTKAFSEGADKFEMTLNATMEKMEKALEGATGKFEAAFSESAVKICAASADILSASNAISESTKGQKDIVDSLKTDQMKNAIAEFKKAADKFSDISSSVEKMAECRNDVVNATNSLVEKQNEYLKELEKVTEKNKTAQKFVSDSTEQLDEYFKDNKKKLDERTKEFDKMLEDFNKQLSETIDAAKKEVEARRKGLLEAINNAFCPEEFRDNLTYLPLIKEINDNISRLAKEGNVVGKDSGDITSVKAPKRGFWGGLFSGK